MSLLCRLVHSFVGWNDGTLRDGKADSDSGHCETEEGFGGLVVFDGEGPKRFPSSFVT